MIEILVSRAVGKNKPTADSTDFMAKPKIGKVAPPTDTGLDISAAAIIRAIDNRDRAGLAKALKTFVMQCEADEHASEDQEEAYDNED